MDMTMLGYLSYISSPVVRMVMVAMSVVFILPSWSHSQEPLGLYDAYRLALENHDVIKLAEEDLYQKRTDIKKAFSQVLPTVTVEGSYIRYSERQTVSGFLLQPDDNKRFEIRINQPLYTGGREWSLLRQAKKMVIGTEKGVELTKEEIIMETARTYYGVLKAKKNVEIKEASLRRAEEQLRVAQTRLQVGTATRTLVLRAEAELAGIKAELVSAQRELKDAMNRLRRITGFNGPFEVYEPPAMKPVDMDVGKLVEVALTRRRDYIQKKIEEEIASEGITYAKGGFLPRLRLEGVYTHRDQWPPTSFLLNDTVYVGLTITFPIFEGGLRKAELDEARSKLRQAELNRINYRKEIELQVREAHNSMVSARSIIESYKKQVSFAKENYNMVFRQFQHGVADNMDVIDANTTLVSAELGLMTAIYDYDLTVLELKKRIGVLLDEIEEILSFL